MAQQNVDSKVGEVGISNDEAVLCAQEKQIPVPLKKTPLRDLRSENNIVPQKSPGNLLPLKEEVTTEAAKVAGIKRPSSEVQMNPHLQSPNNSGANSRLVYVRRKSESETGKTSANEVTADSAVSPQPKQLGHQDDEAHTKSLNKELPTQCVPANAPIPTSPTMCIPSAKPTIPSAKPTIPSALGSLNCKLVSEQHGVQTAASPISLPAEGRANKQNWEERYIELQMYLKKSDQSSLEDHLQMLRSLSALELSRHAIELEKRAIQLSLEQGKELQRVKALNVLGKSLKTPMGPTAQQTPQN